MSSYVRVVSRRVGGTKPLANESIVDISRTSVLGNPFFMRTESERNDVIEKFRVHLGAQFYAQTPVWQAVEALAERVRNGEHLALSCWCAPLPCHGDVIKNAIQFINDKHE